MCEAKYEEGNYKNRTQPSPSDSLSSRAKISIADLDYTEGTFIVDNRERKTVIRCDHRYQTQCNAFFDKDEEIEIRVSPSIVANGVRRDFKGVISCLSKALNRKTVDTMGTSKKYKVRDLLPCLLYTSPSPRDATLSRMPSSA